MKRLKLLLITMAALIVGGGNVAWADKTVYLIPGALDAADATEYYGLWVWGDGLTSQWHMMSDSNSDGIYECTLPDATSGLKLARMSSTPAAVTTYNNYNIWNESGDISNVNNGVVYIAAYDDKKITCSTTTTFYGTYYLYNVGAGKYLCSGNNYGSHASVDGGGIPVSLLKVSDGVYNISTTSIYQGRFLNTNGYMDSDITNWTFQPVGDNEYKITDGTNYLYWNSGTLVTNGTDPGTDASKWKLVTEAERIADMAGATGASPKDVTFLIKNYYFAKGNDMIVRKENSQLSSSPSWKGTQFQNVWGYDADATNTNYAAEQWNKTFDNYQTITAPKGKYKLSCYGYYRAGGETDYSTTQNAYLYANTYNVAIKSRMDEALDASDSEKGMDYGVNSNSKYVPGSLTNAAKAFTFGLYENELDFYVNDVGVDNLTLGVKKTVSVSEDWAVFDNFGLIYYGPTVQNEAVALPGDGNMVANTWYYVDVATTGIHAFKATTQGDIVYTTNADDLVSGVNTVLPLNSLEDGTTRYYVKSSSANNLAVTKICDNFSYWFLRTADYKYLSRGGTYYSQAVADNYGIPVRIAYENDNINFIFVDNWHHLFDAGSQNIYTDADSQISFAIEPTEGGYYIINKNDNGSLNYKLYIDTSDGNRIKASNSNATVWVLESVTGDAHKTHMQALKDAQAAAAATTAGFTGQTTQARLNTHLSSITDVQDLTSSITNPAGISEAYQKDAPNNDEYSVCSYSVSGLATGFYKLSVKGFERFSDKDRTYDCGGGNAGLTYVYANDQKVQLWSVFDFPADVAYEDNGVNPAEDVEKGGKHYPNSTVSAQVAFDAGKYVNEVFVYVTDGTINYGIKIPHSYEGNSVGTSCDNWICYNNFTLTYYGPNNVTMNEGVTYTPEAKFADVTLTRVFTNQWNSFVVPFDIDNATLTEKFGTGVTVATAALSSTGVTFTPMGTPAITANTPVIITGVTKASPYTFNNVLIKAGSATITNDGTSFVGNYTYNQTLPANSYYIKGNELRKSDGSQTINGFRAYFTTGSGVRLTMTIDDEEQGIDDVVAIVADGKMYNLQGQRVNTMRKGLFIKDGKKVVIK